MTKQVPLTKGLFSTVDDDDYETLSRWKWHISGKYAVTCVGNGKRRTMQDMIVPHAPELCVDHINGDRLDNRKANLRVCTKRQNSYNRKVSKNNKVGLKGVSPQRNKFRAVIYWNYKRIHLGLFDSPELAGAAYDRKALELYGEFAKINGSR